MILNLRVDHKIADIESMENISKEIDEIFWKLQKKYSINEYIEISTCNRKEYYLHNENISFDEELLSHENQNIIIEYGESSVMHLLRMTSGLESMIVGEDQILGQVKDAKAKASKNHHCGKFLDLIFTKAIHVGQVVRNKTNINKGSVSIGSAAVDLAERHLGDLTGKSVLVVGAGKMGKLVAKALAEKNLNAIFVANRTFYVAVELAEDLNGTAILFSQLDDYLVNADLVISATSAPHSIINKKRLENIGLNDCELMMVDIANPRDISEDVRDLGVKLFNIDDLREIADYNTKLREKEFGEAEIIIDEEYHLLKESFKIMEVDDLLSSLRVSMEEIRQRETKKASSKLSDVDGSSKILNNLTNSIVNKIFFDISQNLKQAAADDKQEILKSAEYIFDFNRK
ncbi:MAG: glutamyl-tRNA reductase [Methanobrevibacter sp.]|uniref:Glutamyl-tRNA reductase n=1 Tax=Methanobrevibacter millerae TaxID=230361 RepID=A0A8T3V9F2_9EURY|nr:glutamyl-tRNA reductase [Methanobrevibacter millerae]MBE6504709.1 glutamyl-tRNA reductase [Methanobrevibacter millerae]MBQ6345363.1 glutamyl-tRNA reductase [Methanobrevibacter sp.]MBR0369558.1 glutamyl-tRNA reductase [Methanobrevibacter sp.]